MRNTNIFPETGNRLKAKRMRNQTINFIDVEFGQKVFDEHRFLFGCMPERFRFPCV